MISLVILIRRIFTRILLTITHPHLLGNCSHPGKPLQGRHAAPFSKALYGNEVEISRKDRSTQVGTVMRICLPNVLSRPSRSQVNRANFRLLFLNFRLLLDPVSDVNSNKAGSALRDHLLERPPVEVGGSLRMQPSAYDTTSPGIRRRRCSSAKCQSE